MDLDLNASPLPDDEEEFVEDEQEQEQKHEHEEEFVPAENSDHYREEEFVQAESSDHYHGHERQEVYEAEKEERIESGVETLIRSMDCSSQQYQVDLQVIEVGKLKSRKRSQVYYARHKEEIATRRRLARKSGKSETAPHQIEALRLQNRRASQNYRAQHREERNAQRDVTNLGSQVYDLATAVTQ